MQHLLRAISGPHAGGIYVLGRRTTVGRASDCDVQILHEGVSRRHAKVTQQDNGSMMLIDLSSDNGTFVDDERVDRHYLLPGQEVRIMRARYVYEQEHDDGVETSEVYTRKVTSGESLRQTADHGKALAAIRSGMARGLAGDRARPHSRPQAAAPALSGARPGAAGPAGVDDGPSPAERPRQPAEPMEVRRPVPARPVASDPNAPRLASAPAVVDEFSLRTVKPTRETPRPARAGPATVGVPVVASNEGEGNDARRLAESSPPAPPQARLGRLGTGAPPPRVRATVSIAAAGGLDPMPSRGERPVVVRPRSPAAEPVGHETMGRSRTAAGARPARSEAPRSMRPGTAPPVSGEARSAPLVSAPSISGESISVTRRRTAEYGKMGAPEPPAMDTPEAIIDRMRTRPRLRRGRRAAPQAMRPSLGSSTPTEEVPAVVESGPLDERVDDDVYETRPRLKSNPRATRVPLQHPGQAAQPSAAPAPATSAGDSTPSRSVLAYEDTQRMKPPEEAGVGQEPSPPVQGAAAPFPTAQQMVDAFDRLESGQSAQQPGSAPMAQGDAEPGLVFEPRHGIECLVDILEYRQLRLLSLRGQHVGRDRYVALEYQLHHRDMGDDDAAATRRYHRFPCAITAQLTHQTRKAVTTVGVQVLDLSAGGARIEFGEYRIDTGEVVWLAFDLTDTDLIGTSVPRAQTVLFKARVVWTQPHRAQLGVIFAGAPRYDKDVRAELEV